MGELGADPGQLRDLASVMRDESRRARESLTRVSGAIRAARWRGHDAERFRSVWGRCERVVRSATEQLDHAAADLERNADDQLRASDSVVGATSGTPTPVPAASGTSMHTTAADPGPPPLGDPLPLRTEVWEVGGALAAGLGASGTARITVSQLTGGRLAVWLEDVDAVTASVGASVDVGVQGGPVLELGADAGGELAVHTREGWYVDSEELPWLLSRLGLRELMGAGVLSPGFPTAPGGGLGSLFEGATDLLGLSAPEPVTSERLIALGGTAGLSAAVGIPLLGATSAVAHTAGIRTRGGDASLVVGATLDGSARSPGGRTSGGRSLEVEIPLGEHGQNHMIATTTEKVPGGEVLERVVYRLDGDEVAGHLLHATRAVSSGDLDRTAGALAELWDDIELQPIWSDAVGGVIDDDVESLDVGAALGPDLSGSVTGGRRVVTYQR